MEEIKVSGITKSEIYESITPQILSLINGEYDLYANLANITAALKETFNHFWIGFYLVKSDNSQYGKSLVLGPFQGPVACTRIEYGKGVCGTAWKDKNTIIVPNVDHFPGHIACSALSRSEIVVPVVINGEVVAVLDIDSTGIETFDETDALFLEALLTNSFWEDCSY